MSEIIEKVLEDYDFEPKDRIRPLAKDIEQAIHDKGGFIWTPKHPNEE